MHLLHRFFGMCFVTSLVVNVEGFAGTSRSETAKALAMATYHTAQAHVSGQSCTTYTFDATGSYDPDRQDLEYLWNFGDGTSSTEPVVTHEFKEAGEYTVTLTVVDNSGLECDTAITSKVVTVNTPPQARFSAPPVACLDEEIIFDASASDDNTPEVLTYYWDFGDGTRAEGKRVSKKFSKAGTYRVILQVDDHSGTACHLARAEQVITVNTPPQADAGRDVNICLEGFNDAFDIVLDASGSADADNDTLTYYWDFGDGQSMEGERIRHTYREAGVYEAELTVKDSSGSECDIDRDRIRLNLNRRPVAEAGDNRAVCTGNAVYFRAGGPLKDKDLAYQWDFGDGIKAQGRKVQHTYKDAGQYKVVLTVDDGKGTPCSLSKDFCQVNVNTPPEAKVQDVAVHCAGSPVLFDASASSDPDGDRLSYTWDFGDGTVVEAGVRTSHIYTKAGLYTVSLMVDDGKAGKCSTGRDVTVCKINTPPVADAGPNLVCCEGKAVRFDGSRSYDPDGDELTYYWDFGDGESASGPKVEHTYKKRGTYKVVLKVDDASGAPCSSASAGFTAVVKAMPVPVIKVR